MPFIPYKVYQEEITLPTGNKGMAFKDYGAALDYSYADELTVVILGDDGMYWACHIDDALQLEAQGYKWPPLP